MVNNDYIKTISLFLPFETFTVAKSERSSVIYFAMKIKFWICAMSKKLASQSQTKLVRNVFLSMWGCLWRHAFFDIFWPHHWSLIPLHMWRHLRTTDSLITVCSFSFLSHVHLSRYSKLSDSYNCRVPLWVVFSFSIRHTVWSRNLVSTLVN